MVWSKMLPAVLMLSLLLGGGTKAASADMIKLRSVVIDAGHGGHDPGAVGGGLREKDITLDVAMRLGKKIQASCPDVKVLYTRKKDVYVPLNERSAFANRNKADLFISIHVNSIGGKGHISGSETFIMGTDKSASNMEVCKAENSVILLEDDYSTKYAGYDPDAPDSFIFFNLMQNAQFEQSILLASAIESRLAKGPVGSSRGIKQAPLLVLWKTTMPSALVEIGFISNKEDRKILSDKASRDAIAECIFEGFAQYRKEYEKQGAGSPSEALAPEAAPTPDATTPTPAPQAAPSSTGKWTIQVFSLSKPLEEGAPQMKGEKLKCRKVDGLYKYHIGSYNSKFEAAQHLSQVKRKFPGAFIVNL